MVKNLILLILTILLFLNQAFSRIVLPLKILPRENYKLLYPENSTYDLIDNENRQSYYTIFELGSPKQYVPVIIKPKSNFYLLNNVCYNSTSMNNSSDEDVFVKFKFSEEFISKYDYFCDTKSKTVKLNFCRDSEFYTFVDEYCLYNDDIAFYDDINISKNKEVNINFETVEKMVDNITGEIGLSIFDRVGRTYDTFLGVLNSIKLIDNYNWYFDYSSSDKQEAKLIIGSLPHDDFPSLYKSENLMLTGIYALNYDEFMTMKFTRVFLVDNDKEKNTTIEFNVQAEFVYDSNIVLGDPKYKDYLLQKMKDLINEKNCSIDIIRDLDTNRNLTFIYCKKEQNVKNKLKEIIRPIIFYSDNLNYSFELTQEEIIKEMGDYIFIQVLFSDFGSRWNLGKIFTSKYKFVFNQENKTIGFYIPNNSNENYNIFNKYKYIWITGSIIVLSAVLISLGYFIGKYIYKSRKKRANELLDEYDYTQNNIQYEKNKEKNDDIYNVIVDDNNNIN